MKLNIPPSHVHGFVFGKDGDSGKHVTKKENRDGHILVVGGAGSGKSSCIAIPSLMTWKKPVFCIDIKGELYENTKDYRRKTKVFTLGSSVGYNPFYALEGSSNRPQEAEAISSALIPLPPNAREPFFIQSAQNMLAGFILHFQGQKESFIGTMEKILSTPIGKLVDGVYEKTQDKHAKFYMNTFYAMPDKTLASVYAELSRHIILFATDEEIKNLLTRPDVISPNDLENGIDVFVNVPEYLLRHWKGLFSLIVSQFLRHFEKRPDMKATPILFLLDEFARLGKMEGVITDGLATLRSKKITMCLIIQNLSQLDLIYGKDARNVIVGNCPYKAVLNAIEPESQEYFSRLIGTDERVKTSSDLRMQLLFASTGQSKTLEEKRHVKPEEFATLEEIAVFTPYGFLWVERTPYRDF